jgi:uncharacterized membrane protein
MRRIGWAIMAVLSALITAYAVTLLAWPAARPPLLRERFATIPLAAFLHLLGAAVALAIGPLQLNSRLREKSFARHRWLGRTYVLGVLVGGVAALVLATVSLGGLPAHVGFGLLAVLWLGSTATAYLHIRAKDQTRHRQWMIRSYALTFAAVTLRIYLPLSLLAGMPFEPAYQTISWLCWVPNLVIAEWFILQPSRAVSPRAERAFRIMPTASSSPTTSEQLPDINM